MTIPVVADDLTPEWLSEAFGRKITAVTTEPVGVGVGLVGTLFRLQLDGDGEPTTMIAKLAAPTRRRPLRRDGHQHVRPRGRLLLRALTAHVDPASAVLLRGARSRDPGHRAVDGRRVAARSRCSTRSRARRRRDQGRDPHARAAATRASGTTRRSPITTFSCASPTSRTRVRLRSRTTRRGLSRNSSSAHEITPTVKAYGDAYSARIPALFAKMCDGPHVLSHADWRIDNLFETPDGQMVAVDWQLVDRSVSLRDLSYFVTQSVNVDDPAGYQVLFDTYIDELAANGITSRSRMGVGDVSLRHRVLVRVPGRRIGRAHRRGPASSRGLPGDVAPLHYGDGRTRRVRPAALSITPGATMTNLFAALGWTLALTLLAPSEQSLESCTLEAVRLGQRSIMLRETLRPIEFSDGVTTSRSIAKRSSRRCFRSQTFTWARHTSRRGGTTARASLVCPAQRFSVTSESRCERSAFKPSTLQVSHFATCASPGSGAWSRHTNTSAPTQEP